MYDKLSTTRKYMKKPIKKKPFQKPQKDHLDRMIESLDRGTIKKLRKKSGPRRMTPMKGNY
jgi:hypothetical protein